MKQAHDLIAQIDATKRQKEAYREAKEIVVGLRQSHALGIHLASELTLRPHEIVDRIVDVLEQRIEAWKRQLSELGVTTE